jgi:type IV pilus assembly protein PilW
MKTMISTQGGLSLIELMIAMTLGLMITLSLGYIMMGSQSTYRTQDASARVQDSGRFAMDLIGRNLRAAGRVDITPLAGDNRLVLSSNYLPIQGSNGVDTQTAANTGGAVRYTDRLTVRYQLTTLNGAEIRDCNDNGANIGTTEIKKPDGSSYDPPLHYGTVENIISVSYNATLKNFDLRCEGNGADDPQAYAEGVEDLQLLYGIDTDNDDSVNSWEDAPSDWAQVVAVQACIMVRSSSNGVVTAAQSIRDCSGGVFIPGDTRLRRTFISVFTLRNRVNPALTTL